MVMPKGHKLTPAQKAHPSKFKKGQVAWNKGTGGCKRGHDPSLYVPMPGSGVYVCLACKRENAAKYRAKVKNSPEHIIRRRVQRYDLTPEEFKQLLAQQNNRCAICGKKIRLKTLHIDHCHKSGDVRGILCRSCNTAIGLLKDSPGILRRAADYISKGNTAQNQDTTPSREATGIHGKPSKAEGHKGWETVWKNRWNFNLHGGQVSEGESDLVRHADC